MKDKYLVINCGSSSLKFQLFEMPEQKVIAKGNVERIGTEECSWSIKLENQKIQGARHLNNHVEAVKVILCELLQNKLIENINEIKGIGHRVIHGASIYNDSVLIDDKVFQDVVDLVPLAPLHQQSAVAGIKCMMEVLPGIPNVAVFDTAFHQTMPAKNYMYAVPISWYLDYGVRRYGFHGSSHKYITEEMKKEFATDDVNLIICHIGSGASITAIKHGKSYDTSMGLTPLDGLMMGTRSGSIDPSIIEFVKRITGKKVAELVDELNKESGLKGIAGKNDYRDIEKMAAEGDERAQLAIKMFVKKVVEFISDYYFELDGKIDAIVFTAGIGENSSNFRKMVIDEIKLPLGIVLDEEENEQIASFKCKQRGIITGEYSKYKVYVIPTDEEKMIFLDTVRVINEALEKENNKTYVKSL